MAKQQAGRAAIRETKNWIVYDMSPFEDRKNPVFVNSDEATDQEGAVKLARSKWNDEDAEREVHVEYFYTNKADRPAMRAKIPPLKRG